MNYFIKTKKCKSKDKVERNKTKMPTGGIELRPFRLSRIHFINWTTLLIHNSSGLNDKCKENASKIGPKGPRGLTRFDKGNRKGLKTLGKGDVRRRPIGKRENFLSLLTHLMIIIPNKHRLNNKLKERICSLFLCSHYFFSRWTTKHKQNLFFSSILSLNPPPSSLNRT